MSSKTSSNFFSLDESWSLHSPIFLVSLSLGILLGLGFKWGMRLAISYEIVSMRGQRIHSHLALSQISLLCVKTEENCIDYKEIRGLC